MPFVPLCCHIAVAQSCSTVGEGSAEGGRVSFHPRLVEQYSVFR